MRRAVHGLLVVDKPSGITSRDAVDRVQRWFPRGTRIGHTGTLDPLATGVLVLGLGAATRLTEYVQRMSKTYRSEFRLGARSDTDDADGTVTPLESATAPSETEVRACLTEFLGAIEQVPPAFSAAKVTGRRAYDLARRGEQVTLTPRTVQIYAIEVVAYDYPRLVVEVNCGKGTYIRSLARDVGERLGCGGLVQTLRRTRVGPFDAERAVSLDATAETARAAVRPLLEALTDLPRLTLPSHDAQRLKNGQSLSLMQGQPGECAVVEESGALVGVATYDPVRSVLLPTRMLSWE